MPQEISNAVVYLNRSRANVKVRGVALDESDYADLKLFRATDRRSLSFLVRDAISLYLRSRGEELQRFKEANNFGDVNQDGGKDRRKGR
jgi:hypothetical protein